MWASSPKLTIAVHQRNLYAKSHYDGGTYAFLHNVDPGEGASTVELLSTWFNKETVTTSTYDAYSNTIKSTPCTATLNTKNSQQKSTSCACLLPTAFSPLLLDQDVSPVAARPMLCHVAAAKGLTTACKPLWDRICAVGLTANADMRLDIILPINGNSKRAGAVNTHSCP